jgi:O-antigen/teichoic acid export membrane protein
LNQSGTESQAESTEPRQTEEPGHTHLDARLNSAGVSWLFERNVGWNLVGQALPLVVGLVAIPLLIRGLGVVDYGLLILAWAFIGYSSIFDLGLGRALTQVVARTLAQPEPEEREAELIWTSLLLIALLGVVSAILVAEIAPFVVGRVLHIPSGQQADVIFSANALAVAIPMVTVSTGLRGVLEAHQRFRASAAIRLPLGVLTFLAPVATLPMTRGGVLAPVVSLVLVRLGALIAYLVVCLRIRPALGQHLRIHFLRAGPLLRFGGWITVSNLIAPVLSYLDRFVVGFAVSVAAVAYYATPGEMMQRVSVVAIAISGVLFPMFATTFTSNRARSAELYRRGIDYVFLAMFPVTLAGVALSHEILSVWLGSQFADRSAGVLGWFALGVMVNSLAQVPFALIQGAGRADLTGKLHLAEVVPYLASLAVLVGTQGIVGAAIAWTLRATLDLLVLLVMARALLPEARGVMLRSVLLISAGIGICAVSTLLGSVHLKVALVIVVVATMAGFFLRTGFGRPRAVRFEPPLEDRR